MDAARSLLRQNTREVLDLAARGETPTLLDRARYRRDHAFMARLGVRAVSRLFEAGGGHALLESNPLQRFHRDALAASQHFGDPLGRERRAVRSGRPRPRARPDRPPVTWARK